MLAAATTPIFSDYAKLRFDSTKSDASGRISSKERPEPTSKSIDTCRRQEAMERRISSKWIMVLARALDHRIGLKDEDPPELPRLTVEEAMVSFWIRTFLVAVNLITCAAVIANIVCHW